MAETTKDVVARAMGTVIESNKLVIEVASEVEVLQSQVASERILRAGLEARVAALEARLSDSERQLAALHAVDSYRAKEEAKSPSALAQGAIQKAPPYFIGLALLAITLAVAGWFNPKIFSLQVFNGVPDAPAAPVAADPG